MPGLSKSGAKRTTESSSVCTPKRPVVQDKVGVANILFGRDFSRIRAAAGRGFFAALSDRGRKAFLAKHGATKHGAIWTGAKYSYRGEIAHLAAAPGRYL
jgi:hypothetical protein